MSERTARILQFRYCQGCGTTEDKCTVLVAIPGHHYICENCALSIATIVAHQSPEATRIAFVDRMVEMLKEPIEVVAKWKEIMAKRNEATDRKPE